MERGHEIFIAMVIDESWTADYEMFTSRVKGESGQHVVWWFAHLLSWPVISAGVWVQVLGYEFSGFNVWYFLKLVIRGFL